MIETLWLITNTIKENWEESKVHSHGGQWNGIVMFYTLFTVNAPIIRMVYKILIHILVEDMII